MVAIESTSKQDKLKCLLQVIRTVGDQRLVKQLNKKFDAFMSVWLLVEIGYWEYETNTAGSKPEDQPSEPASLLAIGLIWYNYR